MNDPQIQILFDAATIEKKVAALGQKLQTDYDGQDPLLVSILGGSVVFLADLLRAIQRPIRYETVKVEYSPATGNDGLLEIDFPISLSVKGQPLIIIKDVVATGITEAYLISQFQELGAKDIRFVALVDLPEQRKLDIPVDYQLLTPKKPGTFVGYGLKLDGLYGNLPYLGRVVGS